MDDDFGGSNVSLRDEIIREFGVKPEIDVREEIERRSSYLQDYLMQHPGLDGYIIGLSGGLDSAVAAALAKTATDRTGHRTLGLFLPYREQADIQDAYEVARAIGLETLEIDIGPAVDAGARVTDEVFESAQSGRETAGEGEGIERARATKGEDTGGARDAEGAATHGGDPHLARLRLGNRKARQRMIEWYDAAQRYGLLVLGTDHAAEAVTGFFTKYGDGGVDILPLKTLDKRQINQLAGAEWPFGRLPEVVREKAPTAGLWTDQTDKGELGLSYDAISDYLEGKPVSADVSAAIEARYKGTQHKRHIPGI